MKTIKLIIFPFLIIILMVASMNQVNAWVGGELNIINPNDNQMISGNKTFETAITGSHKVNKLSIYGKSVDTSMKEFQLIKETTECGLWDSQKACSTLVDTSKLEDSSKWQFYAVAGNASDESDTVKSTTITNIVVNNTVPLLQFPSYITPNKNEIIRTSDVKFGVLVNPKTTTSCILTFTSNIFPRKKVYITEYEKDEYCNLTITDFPEGDYLFTFAATDGLDVSPNSPPQNFIVDLYQSKSGTQNPQSQSPQEARNWFADNWLWIAGIMLVVLYIRTKRRK